MNPTSSNTTFEMSVMSIGLGRETTSVGLKKFKVCL